MVLPWKILPIDLSEGISDIPPQEGYEKIYAVFWWKTIPLGHQAILAEQLPMSATEIGYLAQQAITAAVSHHLWEGFPTLSDKPQSVDWETLVMLNKPLSKLEQKRQKIENITLDKAISIVVCTRDRPQSLAKCLDALQHLCPPPQEIIVVDNAPTTDATEKLVEKMPHIRYIKEYRLGLSVARNTGLHHATGEIIAFTDDDVVVHPNWITKIAQAFENPRVMALTGMILPAELETQSQQIFEVELGNFGWGYCRVIFDHCFFEKNRSRGVPVWRIGAGANMAFRREILEKVGYFDERLGAGASGCSEDSEMWYRILAEKGICVYEPTAVVFHYHRREMTDLQQQMYQYMRGHVTALLIQYTRYRHWGNLYRLFYDLPKHYFGILMAGFFYGFGRKQQTLMAEVLGCLAGIGFYLRYR